jgi:predicted nucleic acid-binding protein
MIVVADTSPINYLVLIDQIDLLEQLYTRILIPSAVLAELKHPVAPRAVREWAINSPKWLEIQNPKTSVTLAQLDIGESEAIALAVEIHADFVLIDDLTGRQEAIRRGLKVAGTLSVLDEADLAGLVVFDDAVSELRKTSFRVSPAVLSEIWRKRSL